MTIENQYARREFLEITGLAALRKTLEHYFPKIELCEYLEEIATRPPKIGGVENYRRSLQEGIGFATTHNLTVPTALVRGRELRNWMSENDISGEQLPQWARNIYDLTEGKKEGLASRLVDQRGWALGQALESNTYAGLIATRSPSDIGQKYLAFGAPSAHNRANFYFIGAVLVVDCPKEEDWNERLSCWTYNYLGWSSLPWVADVSPELMTQLPAGWSGDPENLAEGRPGAMFVAKDIYDRMNP
ncbi:MAG: hypothetical protein ABIB61_04085 [Candidatus Shapirobacteria bacterium]